MQYNSEPVGLNSIIKLSRNHAIEINTHGTQFKNTMICFNCKEAIRSLMKKKNKETRKKS